MRDFISLEQNSFQQKEKAPISKWWYFMLHFNMGNSDIVKSFGLMIHEIWVIIMKSNYYKKNKK